MNAGYVYGAAGAAGAAVAFVHTSGTVTVAGDDVLAGPPGCEYMMAVRDALITTIPAMDRTGDAGARGQGKD